MTNRETLKWNRKKMGLTQREFAKLADISTRTVYLLEKDETAWETLLPSTYDKIHSVIENNELWPLVDKTKRASHCSDNDTEEQIVEAVKEECLPLVKSKKEESIDIDENERVLLKLIAFAIEGLKESKNHEEFVANIKLIKRSLKDY